MIVPNIWENKIDGNQTTNQMVFSKHRKRPGGRSQAATSCKFSARMALTSPLRSRTFLQLPDPQLSEAIHNSQRMVGNGETKFMNWVGNKKGFPRYKGQMTLIPLSYQTLMSGGYPLMIHHPFLIWFLIVGPTLNHKSTIN